jgi:hypothetical protein
MGLKDSSSPSGSASLNSPQVVAASIPRSISFQGVSSNGSRRIYFSTGTLNSMADS